MSHVKAKPCEVAGCDQQARGRYTMCMTHLKEAWRAERSARIAAIVQEHDKQRRELGLSDTWGCLDPDCEICV